MKVQCCPVAGNESWLVKCPAKWGLGDQSFTKGVARKR
ncbi:hypothetical protein SAMN05216386_0991 [Nitrosospira briensis]|uniref:Uncharacterized protein n=1 Tax=Nitrosospira briensis TaxID=35799 RepID=A0A1I4Z236_9PROT|nr:hypothetical protein SAMN05216386_0991 [Nitrosospira briensis]